MGLWRKILGPSNSLFLCWDHVTDEGARELEAQVEEVRRYYHLAMLSEIIGFDGKPHTMGNAALVFINARRSVFQRAVPWLLSERIPFTLFLRPDCIGLNRLPPEEELELYREHYPERMPEAVLQQWTKKAWEAPVEADAFLIACRREIGPLPIESIDPGLFFTTWGKILALDPKFRELGFYVGHDPGVGGAVISALTFIRQQTGVQVRIAYSPRHAAKDIAAAKGALEPLGIGSLLTARTGALERRTDPWSLPCWPMNPSEEGTRLP